MGKVTDIIQGIKETREARADEKAAAKYREEALQDGLKYWSGRAKEYGVAHDKAIAEGRTNIGYNEYADGNFIGEVYKDQNGAVYQSCISQIDSSGYILETLTSTPTRDGGSHITMVAIRDDSQEKLISYQNSSKPLTAEELIEKVSENNGELWHGRVDKDDNFVPTGNEMFLDSTSKPIDLLKQSDEGAQYACEAFKAFENIKIETLQAQAAQSQGDEE